MFKPNPKREKRDISWILLLGSLFTVPAVSGDMYLPSLPKLMEELNTTQTMAQLTISATMLGAALGQLTVGPLLDRFGRKRPVLVGLGVHVITSLLCAVSFNIYMLFAFRFIQGAANSCANVTGMAVNRDLFGATKSAKMLSRLMLIVGVAPVFAPTLGTTMINFGGWRAIFVLLAILGVLLAFMVWRTLPETLAPENRLKVTIGSAVKLYRYVLHDKTFLACIIAGGLTQTTMMSWVVTAPFVTQQEWNFSPGQFALTFALIGSSMVIGAQINGTLINYIPPFKLLRFAITIQLTLICITCTVTYLSQDNPTLIIALLFSCIFFHTFITANATAIALENHKQEAGTASAIIGICNSVFPSVITPVIAVIGGTSTSMTLVMTLCQLISLVALSFGTNIFIRKSGLPSIL
ncbi:MAG: multidrug effflux MFS transporter [Candidatus Ancillula sp.]|jgi:DHA1 family bicyclomycin/chloramphenicol resistance-like MFS transporter|nr:multidrug effflux MFS transporter [Candidatus Ancillula sp.]